MQSCPLCSVIRYGSKFLGKYCPRCGRTITDFQTDLVDDFAFEGDITR